VSVVLGPAAARTDGAGSVSPASVVPCPACIVDAAGDAARPSRAVVKAVIIVWLGVVVNGRRLMVAFVS